MALKGNTDEARIWNFCIAQGLTEAGAAGLMGNLYAESALNPKNLQNSYEKKLGHTNESYTAAVDSGSYGNFVRDGAGYGLAQWTYWSRKEALLAFARSVSASIGDLEMQLNFCFKELSSGYKAVLNTLKTATTVRAASDSVLLKYERPADMSEAAQERRASYGQKYFDKYAGEGAKEEKEVCKMSNSPLVSYTRITSNKTSPRNHAIDTITIHCIVGQWTAKKGCDYFATTDRDVSANYVVGKDGSIGLSVEEKDRSWCSSNSANDHRAITIEVASDTSEPYAVTAEAFAALLDLVTDICKRNGIKRLVWSESKSDRVNHKNGCNMTVHRDYAAKSCPGTYLYNKHGEIAAEVNKRLGVDTEEPKQEEETTQEETTGKTLYKVQAGAFKNEANATAFEAKLKAAGFDTYVVNIGGLYKVQVGAFSVKANADAMKKKLVEAGYSDAFITTSGGSGTSAAREIEKGSKVRLKQGAKTYTGGGLASFVYNRDHIVKEVSGKRAVITYGGVVVAAVNVDDLTLV